MTSRSDPGGRVELTSRMRRLYLAVCWSVLIATAAAACVCTVLLADRVLHAIWSS